jgi:hypothetical protein
MGRGAVFSAFTQRSQGMKLQSKGHPASIESLVSPNKEIFMQRKESKQSQIKQDFPQGGTIFILPPKEVDSMGTLCLNAFNKMLKQ